MKVVILIIAAGIPLAYFGYLAYSTLAIEKPDYELIDERDGYEIRSYAPYLVAETEVDGDFRRSGESAFRILAGYIFGNNAGSEKMEMTAPVTSESASNAGERMSMTAPVTSTPVDGQIGESQSYMYQFVMEKKYTLETLPKPNDPRVILREIPARTVAVRRYSGGRSSDLFSRNLSQLRADLARDDISTLGTPQAAFYNGPFTLPFLRRNEVILEIENK